MDFFNIALQPNISKIVLSDIRNIKPTDPEILQNMKLQYELYEANPDVKDKWALAATLTIVTACLQSNRLYFCLSRDGLIDLINRDPNYKSKVGNTFHTKQWPQLKKYLYEKYKLIELVQVGANNRSSLYKIAIPAIIEHLETIIDPAEQLAKALEFHKGRPPKK